MSLRRPATLEEMKAAKPAGSKVAYEHATYETARRHPRTGEWITVHRSRSTAKIQYDEAGAFVMRKGQRENLKATHITFDSARPFVTLFRATYL